MPAMDSSAGSHELARLLLNSTGEGIYGVDLEGNCTFANPACLKLLGLIASDEIHPDCPDIREGDEVARMRSALRRPLRVAERLGIPHFALAER